MIKASDILEEYYSVIPGYGNYIPVFVNPTRSELLQASQNKSKNKSNWFIRFSADAEQEKLYVWSGYLAAHMDARDQLDLKCNGHSLEQRCSRIFEGIAEKEGSGFRVTSSHCLEAFGEVVEERGSKAEKASLFLEDALNQDWSWVDKYIDLSSYIDKEFPRLQKIVQDYKRK
jgi:hypothetical protein